MKIVRTKRYSRDLKRIGATEAEVTALESTIASNPTVGDLIPGLAGVRKLRFGLGSKGKRGGARAIYFLVVSDDAAVMLFVYAKSDQEDMTQEERKAAVALLRELSDD